MIERKKKKRGEYVTGKAKDDMRMMLYGQRFPKPGTKKVQQLA